MRARRGWIPLLVLALLVLAAVLIVLLSREGGPFEMPAEPPARADEAAQPPADPALLGAGAAGSRRREVPDQPDSAPWPLIVVVRGPNGGPVSAARVEARGGGEEAGQAGGEQDEADWTELGETTAAGVLQTEGRNGLVLRARAGGLTSPVAEVGPPPNRPEPAQVQEITLHLPDAAQSGGDQLIVAGRVLVQDVDPGAIFVRLARFRDQYGDRVTDPTRLRKLLEYQQRFLTEPDWPNERFWKRGDGNDLGEDGHYWLAFPSRPDWLEDHWRMEVWWLEPRPEDGEDPEARESLLLAFSRPFLLRPGDRHLVEDLLAAAPVTVRARLEWDPKQEDAPRMEWHLFAMEAHGGGGRKVPELLRQGRWHRRKELRLHLPPSEAGRFVRLKAEDGLFQAVTPETLLAPGDNFLGTLVLPIPATLHGRVIDHQSGLPVVNHRVTLQAQASEPDNPFTLGYNRSRDDRTDEEGYYRFDPLSPGLYRVSTKNGITESVEASKLEELGYADGGSGADLLEHDVELRPGEERQLLLEVGRPVTLLTVRVEGVPEGTDVRLFSWPDREDQSKPEFHTGNPVVARVPHGQARRFRTAPARLDGNTATYVEAEGAFGPSDAAEATLILRARETRVELSAPEGLSTPFAILTDWDFELNVEREQEGYEWDRIRYIGLPADGSPRVVVGLPPGSYRARIYSLDALRSAVVLAEKDPYANFVKEWRLDVR